MNGHRPPPPTMLFTRRSRRSSVEISVAGRRSTSVAVAGLKWVHQLQQIKVGMNEELMFQRDVVTSREFPYHGLMLVHSMMFGCAGLFR